MAYNDPMLLLKPEQKQALERFCEQHGVARLSFFGSVTTNRFGPESDIDVLLEFKPGQVPGFSFFRLADELAAILDHKVDLTTVDGLHPYLKDEIIASAQTYYVARA